MLFQQFQQQRPPRRVNKSTEILKELIRSKSFWIFVVVAVLGTVATVLPFFWVVIAERIVPVLGVVIGVITILGVSVQGAETVLSQKEIEQKHLRVLQEIEQARKEAEQQHTKALQEIEQARKEAEQQHTKALQEIEKARDEASAENILLVAEKFATSIFEKEKLVNEAVGLNQNLKQIKLRQLGIEMSITVIDGYDPVTQRGIMEAGLGRGMPGYRSLERNQIPLLVASAITYLRENVLESTIPDAIGLLYLACMYGYRRQFEDMIKTIEYAVRIDETIKEEFLRRKVLQIFLRACDSEQMKLERVRKSLEVPHVSKETFCKFLQNFDLTDFHGFIDWLAIKKPNIPGEKGTFLIKIAPPYPSNEGKVSASAQSIESWKFDTFVSNAEPVTIEELYDALYSSFTLFCPVS